MKPANQRRRAFQPLHEFQLRLVDLAWPTASAHLRGLLGVHSVRVGSRRWFVVCLDGYRRTLGYSVHGHIDARSSGAAPFALRILLPGFSIDG
jgi:hypothetical protein